VVSSEGEARPADKFDCFCCCLSPICPCILSPLYHKGLIPMIWDQLGQEVNLLSPIIIFIIVSFLSALIGTALAAGMASAFRSSNNQLSELGPV
jgi:hypothetical protein